MRVSRDVYDGMYDKPFEMSGYIRPSVTPGAIQNEVTDFLEARNDTIERTEEKEKRSGKNECKPEEIEPLVPRPIDAEEMDVGRGRDKTQCRRSPLR